MKATAIHVIWLFLGFSQTVGAATAESQGHPVTKVIKMLQGLMHKTTVMGKIEANSYSKFVGWCQAQTSTLKDAIEEEEAKISELTDTISGKSKEQKTLEAQIDDLIEQISDLEASAVKAKNVRADENKLYQDSMKDFDGTIQAVEDAIAGLKKAGVETKKGFLLAQQNAKKALALVGAYATEEQRSAINEFLKEDASSVQRPPLLAKGDKDKALQKYDFKSGNVIGLLEAMRDKFRTDKTAAIKAETNSANAYELSSKARDNALKAAQASKGKKESELGEVKKTLSDSTGELKDQRSDKDADTAALGATQNSCLTKKQEWDERSKTRELELEAMETAVKILAKVTGVRTKQTDNPGLPPSPVKFLQLSATGSGSDLKNKAVNLLKETANTIHSNALQRLAVELAAHLDGPFTQVNGMVQKMIFRLQAEQTAEDEHKWWCDKELSKTQTMKEDKDDKKEDLDAKLKAETAAVGQLAEDIKEANDMISKIVASMKEATEIRNIQKKENEKTISDAEEAQQAILNAIGVLETFYKESGMIKDDALVEAPVKVPKAPSTWDSGYTGVIDPTNQPAGIISVLKAVNADFAKLEAETKSQEATDKRAFDEQIQKEEIEKARRSKELEMKGNRKMQRVDAITQMTGSRKNVASELEKTVQYLKDLEPACVTADSSYEKRKAARNKEIDALRKAQDFLSDAFKKKGASFLSVVDAHVQH